VRVKLADGGSEGVATARLGVGAEHGTHRPRGGGVPAQRIERGAGIRMALDVVLGPESLAKIAEEQLADLSLVMDDAQHRLRASLHNEASPIGCG
jgi:hypothetical protein